MKQFNLFRNQVFTDLMHGNARERARAVKRLGAGLIYVGGMNLTSDEAKRWMTGKDSNFEQMTSDEALQTIAYKLTMNSFKNFIGSENPFVDITIPTADIALRIKDDMVKYGQDVAEKKHLNIHGEPAKELSREVVGKLPFVGKLTQMWLLGGADKFNEKERKEKEKKYNERFKM
jgi:hypothetical protein